MPGDQEEDRGRAEGDHHGVGKPPGLPQVRQEVDHGEEVPQKPVQKGEPLDRLQVVAAEDLAGGPQLEAGGGERHHGEEAEAEEKPPGVVVGAAGGPGKPEDKAPQEDRDADGEDGGEYPVEGVSERLQQVLARGEPQEELADEGPLLAGLVIG